MLLPWFWNRNYRLTERSASSRQLHVEAIRNPLNQPRPNRYSAETKTTQQAKCMPSRFNQAHSRWLPSSNIGYSKRFVYTFGSCMHWLDCTLARHGYLNKQESPAVAREKALEPIQFLLQHWPLIIRGRWFSSLFMPFSISGYFSPFPRYGEFSVKNAHFPTPSIQPQIWKCSLYTASPKFCTQRAST